MALQIPELEIAVNCTPTSRIHLCNLIIRHSLASLYNCISCTCPIFAYCLVSLS
jgi:hypothetical protein